MGEVSGVPAGEVSGARDALAQQGWSVLALAAAAPVVAGILVRSWVIRSPLMGLNSDEAFTGLQGYEVLRGRVAAVPLGNQYGAATEAFLAAPLLTFWAGVWPLRVLAAVLAALLGLAVYHLASPLLGRSPALVVALVGWSMSGAVVLLWSKTYMGYTTGVIAQVLTLTMACRAVRTTQRLALTAAAAGVAAGFAMWSHPMFGVVSILALLTPSFVYWRRLAQWWIPAALGGVVGLSSWLVFIAAHGWPSSPGSPPDTSYADRLSGFFTQLLPRVFGLRSMTGEWVGPGTVASVTPVLAGLLTAASLAGLVLLVRLRGREALPVLVSGLLAFPVLALLPPLWFYADARYGLPFVPQLLLGLGSWLLLLPRRISLGWWPVLVVPTVWILVFCVPVVHQGIGFSRADPDADAKRAVAVLDGRGITLLAGSYWSTYLASYLSGGRFDVSPDHTVRLVGQSRVVDAADPADVALVYPHGAVPRLRLPATSYRVLHLGSVDLYLPVRIPDPGGGDLANVA